MGLLDRFKNRAKEETTPVHAEPTQQSVPAQETENHNESVEVVQPSFSIELGSGLHQVIERMRSYGADNLTLDLNQHGNDMNYVLSDHHEELERGVVTPDGDWFDAVAKLYTDEEKSERGAWKSAQIVTGSTLGEEGAVTASFTNATSGEVSTISSSLAQPGLDLADEQSESAESAYIAEQYTPVQTDTEVADTNPAGFEESSAVEDDYDPFVQADSVAPASSLLSDENEVSSDSSDIDAQNRFDRIMKRIEEDKDNPQELPSFEEVAFASDPEPKSTSDFARFGSDASAETVQGATEEADSADELTHQDAVEAAQQSYNDYSATDTGLIAQTGGQALDVENAEATDAEIETYVHEEPALTDAELNDREFDVEDEALEAQEPTDSDLTALSDDEPVVESDESLANVDPYAEDSTHVQYFSDDQELAELTGEQESAEPYDEEDTFDEEFTREDELTDDDFLAQTDGIIPETDEEDALAEAELATDDFSDTAASTEFENTEFANTDFDTADEVATESAPAGTEAIPLADVTHGDDVDVQGEAAVPSLVDDQEWEQDAFAATGAATAGTAVAGATYAATQKADQSAPTSGTNLDVSSSFSGAQNTSVSMPSKTQLATGNMVLTEAEVAQRLKQAQDALFGENGTARDVSTVLIRVRSLGSYYDALTHVRRDGFWDQQKTFELVPEEILDILQLKSDSYREGFGSPLAMMFRFTPGVPVEASFDYANEEAFVQYTDHLPAQQYVEELRMFPRTGANIPAHMNEALASWTL